MIENKDYYNTIKHWNKLKINKIFAEKIPLENFIFKNTDILLQSILNLDYPIFERILNSNFSYNQDKFNYFSYILQIKGKNSQNLKIMFLDKFLSIEEPKKVINSKNNLNGNTNFMIACNFCSSDIIRTLSLMGGDWSIKNNLGQNAVYTILRKKFNLNENIVNSIKLQKDKINIYEEDEFNISIKDIIKNYLIGDEWIKNEYNLQLIEILNYQHWE